jgi:tRNA(Arg) A34 adenosine deaminase TadA
MTLKNVPVSTLVSSPRDLRILLMLQAMAEDVEPVANARLAACVALRGKIVSWGQNSVRTHPFQREWGKNEHATSWHAETHAIHNSLRRISAGDLARTTLYVVRVKRPHETSREWMLGMSRPCPGCWRCIQEFDIGRICYSTEEQQFVWEQVAMDVQNS